MAIQRSSAAAACAVVMWAAHAFPETRRRTGKPGVFDYYVLALSWSPQFCAGPNGASEPGQCSGGRRFGFVVHGLWPQYERGYPENCAPAPPLDKSLVQHMLPLMPSPQLIAHEWRAHGTCSGLNAPAYFGQVEKARGVVAIPKDFETPAKQVMIMTSAVKTEFERANPSMPADAFRIACSGRYLSEVRVCLTKDLRGRACSTDLRDSCHGEIIMRPLR
jgi:ribonuclease T2